MRFWKRCQLLLMKRLKRKRYDRSNMEWRGNRFGRRYGDGRMDVGGI